MITLALDFDMPPFFKSEISFVELSNKRFIFQLPAMIGGIAILTSFYQLEQQDLTISEIFDTPQL